MSVVVGIYQGCTALFSAFPRGIEHGGHQGNLPAATFFAHGAEFFRGAVLKTKRLKEKVH